MTGEGVCGAGSCGRNASEERSFDLKGCLFPSPLLPADLALLLGNRVPGLNATAGRPPLPVQVPSHPWEAMKGPSIKLGTQRAEQVATVPWQGSAGGA